MLYLILKSKCNVNYDVQKKRKKAVFKENVKSIVRLK